MMLADVLVTPSRTDIAASGALLVILGLVAWLFVRTRRAVLLPVMAALVAGIAWLALRRELSRSLTSEELSVAVQDERFRFGLSFGLAAVVLGGLAAVIWRLRRRSPLPVFGLLLTAATCVGLEQGTDLPGGLLWGLGGMAVLGLVADLVRPCRPLLPLLLLPFAWLVAYHASVVEITWVRLFVMGATCLGGPLLASFDRRWAHRGFAPLLLAASTVGMYFTVPEVRFISVLLAATLAMTILGWPFPLASLGANGSLPMAGLVAWTMAMDGHKRSASVIAGVACLGLLLVEPAARLVRPSLHDLMERATRPWWAVVPLGLAHLVVVYLASRVAGMEISPTPGAVIAGADLGIALVVLVAAGSAHDRRSRREMASPP